MNGMKKSLITALFTTTSEQCQVLWYLASRDADVPLVGIAEY